MANLARHASLRFSVFEVAADLGLETTVLDGNFNPIIEEDEDESPTRAPKPERRTQSSDELTDSPYPLTPPSSNDALYTTRPLLLNKKIDEKPKFIENFSSTPIPVNAPPQRPTTPRSGSGKLRKMQPPPLASSPPLELRLDFGTDIELTRRSRDRKKGLPDEQILREKSPAIGGGKKSKDRSQHGYESSPQGSSPMPTPDEEDKGLLGGLLRFRTRSKERKAAAKQALQQVAEPYRSMTPPIKSNSPPPPLPIALRFARQQQEELSFRSKAQESESSHGGGTSVGHTDTSVGHQSVTSQGNSDDLYPRARNRSSRYERPHPVWRSGPSSTIGKSATVPLGEGAVVDLPQERHAYPPNQTIFDREPAKQPRVPINNSPSTPAIDMDAVNKYYGITPVASNTPAANIPSVPSPQSRFALTQALDRVELKVQESPATPRMTPTTMAPASPSPYIVPSPAPTQEEFAVRKREKPGRMNKPPALDPSLVASRRKMAQYIPPPTPPPTTELPPIPTDIPLPPSAALRPPFPSPLAAARSPSPNMRMGSTGLVPPPPPYSERSATATPEVGNRTASPMRPVSPPDHGLPARAASPIQRGKTLAFPIRPITPNRDPRPPVQKQQTSPVATRQNQPFLLNRQPDFGSRRPEYGASDFARPRRSSLNEQDLAPLRGNLIAEDPSLPVAIPRKRSLRKTNRQSGYDSDDAESRYSRDTYYGRDTAYFDDQNMPPLPGEPMPALPRDFGNLEQERKAGRERLLKFLANRDA